MKVWTLEDGEYSNYSVNGVYSSRSNAEAVQSIIGGDIVERELNPGLKEIRRGWKRFMVIMGHKAWL